MLGVFAGSEQFTQTASAIPTNSVIEYSGPVKTKINAQLNLSSIHDISVTTAGSPSGPMTAVAILADPPASQGQLSIDTSDLATWKPAQAISANQWVFKTKASNAATAGVYLNGALRPLQTGATLTVKFIGGAARSSLYLKLTGIAPTGIGVTKASIEAETTGMGADRALYVLSTDPAQDALVATDSTILVVFSENIDGFDALAGAGVTIDCGSDTTEVFSAATEGSDSVRFTPAALLPNGATCTVTIPADAPSDADANDPPSGLDEDYTFSFTTDAAPSVTTATPDGTADVSTTQSFTFDFSEAVDLAAGAYTYTCSPSGANGILVVPVPNVTSVTINGAWIQNDSCTVTIDKDLVTDVDALDPPDGMNADYVFNFHVDAAPFVVSTVPANGAVGASPVADSSITFSEPVNLLAGVNWTRFDCGPGFVGDAPFQVSQTGPQTTFTFPGVGFFANKTCTMTLYTTGWEDADTVDGPNFMVANYVYTFTYGPLP